MKHKGFKPHYVKVTYHSASTGKLCTFYFFVMKPLRKKKIKHGLSEFNLINLQLHRYF